MSIKTRLNFHANMLEALRNSNTIGLTAACFIEKQRQHMATLDLENSKLQRQVEDQAREIKRLHVQIAEAKTRPA